jgi:hypothetical protein
MRVQGKILSGARGGGYCFASGSDGKQYFIHYKEFRLPTQDYMFTAGTVLEFEAVTDNRNRLVARDITIITHAEVDKNAEFFGKLCSGDLRDANLGGHRNPRRKQ